MPGTQGGEDESNDCVEDSQKARPGFWTARSGWIPDSLGEKPRVQSAFVLYSQWEIPRATAHPTWAPNAHSLGDLIWFHQCHPYADTCQVYVSRPNLSSDLHIHTSKCLFDIVTQVSKKHSKLRVSKTKLLIFTLIPQHQLSLSPVFHILINGYSRLSMVWVEDLGVCSHTPHSTHQQILTTLPLRYFQNSTISWHPCH